MPISNDVVSPPCADQSIGPVPPDPQRFCTPPHYVATATEAVNNYRENPAAIWYKDNTDPNDPAGKYAFQRLRQTWFIPHVAPKFKLHRQDKFYAIGSCFARGLENSLVGHKITVESAAPQFARLQPARPGVSPLGFTNKYNTYSILKDRKSTRLNSSHRCISYAVFCLKKKKYK